MDWGERDGLLTGLSGSVDKIIIVDYLCPRSGIFRSALNEAVEFTAGRDHYRNFRSFVKNGGIAGLVNRGEFQIIDEIKNKPVTSHVVVLKKA